MWLPPLFHATLGSALSAPASSHFRTNTEKGRGGACWGWEFAFPLCFFCDGVCGGVCVVGSAEAESSTVLWLWCLVCRHQNRGSHW